MNFRQGVAIELPILSCDGCGACCDFARTPPHMVLWQHDQPLPMRGKPAAGFDLQVLMAAPEEARRLIIEKRQSDSATSEPCAWLDQESRRCRFYDFRPEACRSFEPGSEPCVMVRKYKFG